MPIYTTISLKGGVGKTTTAIHLAAVAAEDGRGVTVLDADDEQSAIQWASFSLMPFEVVAADRDGLAQQARALTAKDKHHVVIIDTPPNSREILTRAGMLADVCIVPVTPTGVDMNRLTPTLKLLRDIEATRGGKLDVAILLCKWDGHTILAREAVAALKGWPLLRTKIRGLERYAQAFSATPTYLDEYRAAWKELRV